MKITKKQLKRIIKEELNEMAPMGDPMEAPPAPPLPIELTRDQIQWLISVVEYFDAPTDSDIQMQQSILDALRAGGQM